MKIHNPTYKNNTVPRLLSIFPFFLAIAFFPQDSVVIKIFSLLLMSLAIYTFFFTRSEYYIDTAKGEVIKTIKWLFIATNRVESINQYRAVVICLGDNVPNSNWQAATSKQTYDVVLVRKHASTNTLDGSGALENFFISTHVDGVQAAKNSALEVADLIGLPVESDAKLVQWLTYDPIHEEVVRF